jgi:hypothetical protein
MKGVLVINDEAHHCVDALGLRLLDSAEDHRLGRIGDHLGEDPDVDQAALSPSSAASARPSFRSSRPSRRRRYGGRGRA